MFERGGTESAALSRECRLVSCSPRRSRVARLERRLFAFGHSLLRHCQHHRHRHVGPGERREINNLLITEVLLDTSVGLIRNLVPDRQLGDEIIDRCFVGLHPAGPLVGFEVGRDLGRESCLGGKRLMGKPTCERHCRPMMRMANSLRRSGTEVFQRR